MKVEVDTRDWFAGQALAASAPESRVPGHHQHTADICYELADAMLRVREKDEEE